MSHAFEGIRNFRDFGGYVAGSRRLKRGLLFRSAHHADATESDLDAMERLGVSVIVNLLRPAERERLPSRRPKDCAAATIVNDEEESARESWDDFLLRSDLSAASFRGHLERFYASACFSPRYVDLFSRYFSALAEADGAVLVHCAGGKDRTGILVALTHHLAGVHRDDALADFLLTNDGAHMEHLREVIAAHVAQVTGRLPDEAAMHAATRVEPAYLDTTFASLKAHYGSIDAYLENMLGVDHKKRTAIEARLLE